MTSREVAETEVESVAFVVCDAIGLDTGNFSFPYVARWSGGEGKVMRETAARVVDCASQLLTALEIHEDNGHMAKRAV